MAGFPLPRLRLKLFGALLGLGDVAERAVRDRVRARHPRRVLERADAVSDRRIPAGALQPQPRRPEPSLQPQDLLRGAVERIDFARR